MWNVVKGYVLITMMDIDTMKKMNTMNTKTNSGLRTMRMLNMNKTTHLQIMIAIFTFLFQAESPQEKIIEGKKKKKEVKKK